MVRAFKILFTSYFLLLTFFFHSQTNLVPNGSFENYSLCPTSVDQTDYSNGWTRLRQTPDYFNACSTSTCNCYIAGQLCVSVPSNCSGFQYAASGNAYVGFCPLSTLSPNYREIIGAQLTNTLSIGQKYFIKFKLAFTLDNNSNSATDKIGIRFSTVQHNSVTALPPINNFAHVYTTTFVTDTTNWTTIFKSFVADSTYGHVEIGNFFNDANTNKQVLRPQASDGSYYYFDDFCVSTDSLFSLNYTTGIENILSESNFKIYPNPSNGTILYFNQIFKKAEVSIINALGTLVKSININSSDYIDVDLPSGIYFIQINTNEKIISEKIIINNP